MDGSGNKDSDGGNSGGLMTTKRHLNGDERDFFSLLRAATFANPFSDERVALDLQITGQPPTVADADRVKRVTQVVHDRIRKLEASGRTSIRGVAGPDRDLLENAFLFDFFHQYLDRFDEVIPDQIAAGDTAVRIPFADEALTLLRGRGFDPQAARRYFALCFQIRRAFYFIDRSLVGRSPCMKRLRRDLWNNVFTHDIGLYNAHLWNRMEDFSTLILGSTGTGKGTAAAAIGRSGFIPFDPKHGAFAESFVRSFISLNLSQFPETLIESELFGHRKGAFTGAMENYRGVLQRCSPHGAILLDEIGEVSIPVQIKLLGVLQERAFTPVGGHERRRFGGRVIAATNQSVEQLRREGRFRDDFYYRLCSDVIRVPPLAERIREAPAELDDLIAHTVGRIVGEPSAELAGMVREVIDSRLGPDYPWPGNVRELEQCVRRVLLKRTYEGDGRTEAEDLLGRLLDGAADRGLDAQGLIEGYCARLYRRAGTYEATARLTGLDRRTVKKYIQQWHQRKPAGNGRGMPTFEEGG
jgi:DNA-binding NtrC family response regulator